jgi:hypothetical protein
VRYELGFYIPEDGILHSVLLITRRFGDLCVRLQVERGTETEQFFILGPPEDGDRIQPTNRRIFKRQNDEQSPDL